MTYSFQEKLAQGKNAEEFLDKFFGRWYRINDIPLEIEKRIHADRLFVDLNGTQTVVEYKTDFMCHQTGNLIVETISADTTNTPGWVYSCQADMLIWWVVGLSEILCLRPVDLRANIAEWEAHYRKVTIKNEGYNTIGIAVPINRLRRLAVWQSRS